MKKSNTPGGNNAIIRPVTVTMTIEQDIEVTSEDRLTRGELESIVLDRYPGGRNWKRFGGWYKRKKGTVLYAMEEGKPRIKALRSSP
jgi:hypothetical protein